MVMRRIARALGSAAYSAGSALSRTGLAVASAGRKAKSAIRGIGGKAKNYARRGADVVKRNVSNIRAGRALSKSYRRRSNIAAGAALGAAGLGVATSRRGKKRKK